MSVKRRLVLHYITVVVVCVLLSVGVSIAAGYVFGGFELSVFGSTLVWHGIMPDNVPGMVFVFTLSFVGTFFFITLFYARRMSAPIFLLLDWVDRLSRGDYTVPHESFHRRKSPQAIRLYGDLNGKMVELTNRLKQSELERERLETMRKEWTAGITHDLKTPLSYIHGYTAMLLSNEHAWTEEERRAFLAILQEKARHIEQLIEDLSDSFRFEQGAVPLHVKPLDMVAFLQSQVDDLRHQPAAQSFRLHFRTNVKNLVYHCDEQLMRRALLNVLMNAVLHNHPGTEITISLEKADLLEIVISDSGRGMSEWEQKHLFERYYRGTSTDTPAGGTGLGMAIAKELIALHGGTIRVQSVMGQGTAITFSLPLPV